MNDKQAYLKETERPGVGGVIFETNRLCDEFPIHVKSATVSKNEEYHRYLSLCW